MRSGRRPPPRAGSRGTVPPVMHALVMLDAVLASDKYPKSCTGLMRKHFDYLLPHGLSLERDDVVQG